MANRTLWPEGVEVHQRGMEYDTDQRIASDRAILTDTSNTGIFSGLVVSINGGDPTKVDLSAGSGYAPNGDFMELAVGQAALSMATMAANAVNYIVLMYDETPSLPEAHETNGTTQNTRATASPRIVVLSAAQYTALNPTDSILSNNAADRALVCGLATINNAGTAVTSVTNATSFPNVLFISQPSAIGGVTIIDVDPNTPTGTGTLAWTFGTTSMTWAAPGDVAGAPVTFTTSTQYTLTSSGGTTIVVDIAYSGLPVSNASQTVTVTDIYGQTVSRFSARDVHHRSLIGSGVPSLRNPHGMTLEDIAPGGTTTIEEHQDVMHANGIAKFSSPSFLASTVNTGPAPDTLTITNYSVGDIAYINGRRIAALTTSNLVTFGTASAEAATYTIYLGQDGQITNQQLVSFPLVSLLADKIQILDVVGIAAGTHTLNWDSFGIVDLNSGPSVDATVVLADQIVKIYNTDRSGYLVVWMKGAGTPGVSQSDTITIYSAAAAEENIPLCNVPWSGLASGFLGYGFASISNAPNLTYDKRQYGNLTETEVRTDAGMINAALMVKELLGDGILVKYDERYGANTGSNVTPVTAVGDQFAIFGTGLPRTYNGGTTYLDGRRVDVNSGSLTLSDNALNRIYIDSTGAVQVTVATWEAISVAQFGRAYVPLYEVTMLAGVETLYSDIRGYVGQKRNLGMGVVGLNEFKMARLIPDVFATGPTLDVFAAGSFTAIRGYGGTGGANYAIEGFANGGVGLGTPASTPTNAAIVGWGSNGGEGLFGVGGITGGTAVGGAAHSASNGAGGWFTGAGTGNGARGDATNGSGLHGKTVAVAGVSAAIYGENTAFGRAMYLTGGLVNGSMASIVQSSAGTGSNNVLLVDGSIGGAKRTIEASYKATTPVAGYGCSVLGFVDVAAGASFNNIYGIYGSANGYASGGFFENYTATGPAAGIGDGGLRFRSNTLDSNTGEINTIVAANTPKAWGYITSQGGASGFILTNESYNVNAAMAGGNIYITFIKPMAGNNYSVVATASAAATLGSFIVTVVQGTQVAAGFQLQVWDTALPGYRDMDTFSTNIQFQVFGRQAL